MRQKLRPLEDHQGCWPSGGLSTNCVCGMLLSCMSPWTTGARMTLQLGVVLGFPVTMVLLTCLFLITTFSASKSFCPFCSGGRGSSKKQDWFSNLCARLVYHNAQSLHSDTTHTHTHTRRAPLSYISVHAANTHSWNSFPCHMKCSYCSFLLLSPYQEVFTWTRGKGNEFSEQL